MSRIEGHVLLVDDDDGVLDSLQLLLKDYFQQVDKLSNPEELPAYLERHKTDILLLDMNFKASVKTGNEGLYWLKEIRKAANPPLVILITAFAEVDLAVEGMRQGAFDFLTKPWDNERLLVSLRNAWKYLLKQEQVKELKLKNELLQADNQRNFGPLISASEEMNKIRELIAQVAPTDAPVLILGENGTGKELIAREIHQLSNRSNKTFMSVDMGSLTETLFESELFGHTKGSFTGAHQDKPGRFEAADGGTLFLDEIGNLPLSLQGKILTVLQNKRFSRLGSNESRYSDFRLITATNKPLHKLVSRELFREDLLFRLNTITLEIPPLRKRREDILPLAEHFLDIFSRKYGKTGLKISLRDEKILRMYAWPGNIRELQHSIEKAVILGKGHQLYLEDLRSKEGTPELRENKTFSMEENEKSLIRKVLLETAGNISKSAELLGISRPALYQKIKKYEV